MKKITLCIILVFLLTQTTHGNTLILIEVGDTWTYDVGGKGEISFEAKSKAYIPYDIEEEVRVNEISFSEKVDILNIKFIEGTYNLTIFATSPTNINGSANLEIAFGKVFNDVIYRTARGYILYKRVTLVETNFSFTDILINEELQTPYQETTNITITELCTNGEIIETISTGSTEVNERTFDGGYGYINETVSFGFYATITERYEVSNVFTYQATECVNLTIEPIDAKLELYFHTGDYLFDLGGYILPPVPAVNQGYPEDWIYSFDAGLPLEMVKHAKVVSQSSTLKQVVSEPITMKLVAMDLINSDFVLSTSTETTNVSIWLLSLMMATYIMFYIKKKRGKDL